LLQPSPGIELVIDPQSTNPKAAERIGVIDLIAYDPTRDEAVLVMNQPDRWDGSEAQLHELQERFNTYVSFLLDGEFAECNPELANKRARIEVRCRDVPNGPALDLLGAIHDQLAFQEIKLEVIVKNEECRDSNDRSKNH
jgi:hypothetical protein